ncbi:MAG: ROK family transcriptional regulator [Pseudomonadota bacterium]
MFDQDRGSNQAGTRAYNERLVLSLVRRHDGLAKADIARSTGLSPQTVSLIMRSLESDGLLRRGDPVKGRVGQPSVPMHLEAGGAFTIGLKIGRRSADLVLMDFAGTVRQRLNQFYPYPTPETILSFAGNGVENLVASLPASQRHKVAGIGVATPFQLWKWADDVGVDPEKMASWRDADIADQLGKRCGLPVYVQNDATAACGAELIMGRGEALVDFVYFFVGFFVGGGIVLNNSVYSGRSGNAGAFGPMPVPSRDGGSRQLIQEASIFTLERQLQEEGADPAVLWEDPADWTALEPQLSAWIDRTATGLAHAIVASCAVVDFPAAIIDGGFPAHVRKAVVAQTRDAVSQLDLEGLQPLDILEGSIGSHARAIGGALLPFFDRYLADQNVLFKQSA